MVSTGKVLAAFATLSLALPALHAEEAKRPPNVIVILADDLGYGDVSCNGQGKLKTPNIDRIATGGVRMTTGYAPASVCTPTRYALLTGEYPWRKKGTGILPGDAGLIISPSRLTLPRIFKNAGYATGAVGKWHLGLGQGKPDFNTRITPGLNELGFDYSFHMAATGDRVPCVYLENGQVVNLDPNDPIQVSYGKKVGDWMTLTELRKLRAARAPGEAAPADEPVIRLDSTQGHADTIVNGIGRIGFMTGGKAALWDDRTLSDTFNEKALHFIRQHKSKPFFLYYGSHEPHEPRDPNPRFLGKSGISKRGDAILQLDEQVGKILDTLKQEGLEKDTLVILSSDNGPAVFDGYADGSLADETKVGHHANGRWRGGKGTEFEGGVRVPFLARWPGHIQPGSVCHEVVSLVDLPATASALTGQELTPADAPDSIDIMPALSAGKQVREAIVFSNPEGRPCAIREGRWKLFLVPQHQRKDNPPNLDTPPPAGVPLLFDLDADPTESVNLAAKEPEVVTRLTEKFQAIVTAGFTRPGATKVDLR